MAARQQAPTNGSPGYSGVSDFKKLAYTDLLLPSGKRCAAKRVGLEAFIKSGKVPNSLLPMMKGALKGDKVKIPTLEEIDVDMIFETSAMFDLATVEAVVIPVVHPVPERGEDGIRHCADGTIWERDDDLLYVDEIELEDKQFIFQWAVGGVTDVAKFRSGTKEIMANIQAGKGVVVPTKRAAPSRR